MREILFRGKRIDNWEWVEGDLRQDKDLGTAWISGYDYYIDADGLQREPFEYEISPETICQYTGLTDKNGRKIWENDIVNVRHEKYLDEPDAKFYMFPKTKEYERKYAVEFVNTGSNYGYRCRNRSIHFLITKNTIYNHKIEVIGNIFDNPELMEGEQC